MLIGIKVRLKPTKEQEALFWKSAGTSRWAYNYFLKINQIAYNVYRERGKGKRYVNEQDVRKYINNILKKKTHKWLKEVGSNVMKQAVKDADLALKDYCKDLEADLNSNLDIKVNIVFMLITKA